MKYKYNIGIDPAFRKGGFSICIIDNETMQVEFVKIIDFVDFGEWLKNYNPNGTVFIQVEDSSLTNATFTTAKHAANKQAVSNKISRNVGANQAVSSLTVQLCKGAFGRENVKAISPLQKGAKITNQKLFAAIVASNKHTFKDAKKMKKTSQDNRDAYMVAVKKML